jgi:MIP family channel proteins
MSAPPEVLSARGRRLIAEGVGTFFLVLIGPGAAMVNAFTGGAVGHVGVSLAFAFVVTAMVFALGHLSGAHINPAVTLAFWSVRRFPTGEVVPYIAAQCTGASLASLALVGVLGPVGQVGATLPGVGVGKALGVEWLLSFALMFVIMGVATDERVPGGFAALAVGFTVGFCALMGGPLTGASMNPARSLGPALVGGMWQAHWVYWVAPIAGMLAAARVYELLRRTESPALPAEIIPRPDVILSRRRGCPPSRSRPPRPHPAPARPSSPGNGGAGSR